MKRILIIASLLVVSTDAFAAASQACIAARKKARADYQDAVLKIDDAVDAGKISVSAGRQYKSNAAQVLAHAEDLCAVDADIIH